MKNPRSKYICRAVEPKNSNCTNLSISIEFQFTDFFPFFTTLSYSFGIDSSILNLERSFLVKLITLGMILKAFCVFMVLILCSFYYKGVITRKYSPESSKTCNAANLMLDEQTEEERTEFENLSEPQEREAEYLLIILSLLFVATLWWKIERYLKSKNHDDVVGAGRKGFKNRDRVSCYANSAVQCLFSIDDNLFNVLPHLRGPISKEIERLAFSSFEKTESTEHLRKLLPSGLGFGKSACQCICEFWENLFISIDAENVPIGDNQLSYQSPLSEIFHFENRKYLVCDICQWSEVEDHQISGKILYLAVPTLDKFPFNIIPFKKVLNPSPVGRHCPNGHALTSRTIFTKTNPFLAVNLNRNGSGSKNNANIVNIDLDEINLEAEEESSGIDSGYHELLISSVKYKAVAVAVHLHSLYDGHYLVYRRTPKGGWYCYNDHTVNKVDLNDTNRLDKSHQLPQMTFLVLKKC